MKGIAKFALILGIICIASFVLAGILFVSVYGDYKFNNPKYYKQVNQFEQYNLIQIDKISVDSASEDIIVNAIEGKNATFNFTGFYNYGKYENPPKLVLEKNGNELNINIKYEKPMNLVGISSQEMKINIGIPKEYAEDLSVSSASGDVKLNEMNLADIVMETASGDINVKNLNSHGNTINSVSGDIIIENSKFEDSSVKSVSGDINIINSGTLNILETTSGEITIENYEITRELKINTISGDINLDLSDNSSVNVIFDSVSGDLKNDFGNIYNGKNNIYTETTSGDLRVY